MIPQRSCIDFPEILWLDFLIILGSGPGGGMCPCSQRASGSCSCWHCIAIAPPPQPYPFLPQPYPSSCSCWHYLISAPARSVQASRDVGLSELRLLVPALPYLLLTFQAKPSCKHTAYTAVFLHGLTQTSSSPGMLPKYADSKNLRPTESESLEYESLMRLL